MVLAIIIQTLDSEEPEVLYYRFYSAAMKGHSSSTMLGNQESSYLYHSNIEKKDLIYFITKRVHMLYSLKLKQSLIPVQNQDRKTLIKGFFTERNWKTGNFMVIWGGAPGIGFSLLCEEEENVVQAQLFLDLLVSELEKYLQIISYPLITTKIFNTIALIIDHFLPSGQLLFINNSLIKSLEKQLELNVQV